MIANRKSSRIRSPRLRVTAAAAGVATLLAGCAAPDRVAGVDDASALVAARTASDPGWSTPWFEPADAWDGVSPLTSDAAVRVALQGNRVIRAEVESIVASRADFEQAHLLPNPVIKLALGFPTDGLGGEPLVLQAVQQLTWLWRRPAMIDAADARLRSRVLAVSDAALRLVAETRTAHAAVAFAERAASIEASTVELHTRSTALLHDRLAAGEASRLEVDRAERALSVAEVRLADRRSDLAAAKRLLLKKMGRADASAAWRTPGVESPADAAIAHLDETRIAALAGRQRLDVAAAEAAVDARAAALALADAGRAPDVDVGVGYERNFSDRPGVFPSVAVTPKIFDDNGARVAKAESELRSAQITADGARQAAIAEARSAWVRLRGQLDAVRSHRDEIVTIAERNERLTRESFDAGETDLPALLETQRRRNDAELALNDRERRAAELLFELERAAGGSLATQPPLDEALAASASASRAADRGRRTEDAP